MYLKFLIPLGFLALVAGHDSIDSRQQVRVKELYNSVINKDYYASVRPYGVNSTDFVTLVTLEPRDVNVLQVDDVRGFFTFQSFCRREWVDPRLAYNDTSIPYIPIREIFGRSIWTPDLYFLNGVEISTFPRSYHSETRSVRFHPNGRVFWSERLTQTIYCPALFQTNVIGQEIVCPVRVGSYGYYSDELRFVLNEEGVNAVKDVFIPNYTFGGVTFTTTCDGARFRSHDGDGHEHSCVQINFKFTKNA